MKTALTILITLLAGFSAPAVHSATNETVRDTDLNTLFVKAQEMYDGGNYSEAITNYESLLSRGCRNSELHFNLGNAYFRNGTLPQAVQNYRLAWYQTPRDPDIRANLGFALEAAQAAPPKRNLAERFADSLSLNEWVITAVTAYSILMLCIILALLIRPAKRLILKAAILPAVALLFAGAGIWSWHRLTHNPELIVTKTGVKALFAPIENTTAHYRIPPGSIVRQRDTNKKGWINVEYDGKKGWMKEEQATSIFY